MTRLISAVALAVALAGCASTPASVQIQGNGFCHPSADLPASKAVKLIPEGDTRMDDLYGLLAAERKDHAADDRDYNSLYNECVGGSK